MGKIKYPPILPGQRFGRLLILQQAPPRPGKHRSKPSWLCLCDCGIRKSIPDIVLKTGESTSCGCYTRELFILRNIQRSTTHGGTQTVEYTTWTKIKSRTTNPNDPKYPIYGGRGITVCDRWRDSFENFFTDMGPRPSSHHSIERINNNLSYSPKNCIWATEEVQANNRRNNHLVTYHNKTLTLAQWEKETGITQRILSKRLRLHWTVEEALTIPIRSPKRKHHE